MVVKICWNTYCYWRVPFIPEFSDTFYKTVCEHHLTFCGFGVYFVRFPWFLLQVRDIQPPNPCISLLTQQSNGHRKNRLTRSRQVRFHRGGKDCACRSEQMLTYCHFYILVGPLLFNFKILSLFVTSKSFIVRLLIY